MSLSFYRGKTTLLAAWQMERNTDAFSEGLRRSETAGNS